MEYLYTAGSAPALWKWGPSKGGRTIRRRRGTYFLIRIYKYLVTSLRLKQHTCSCYLICNNAYANEFGCRTSRLVVELVIKLAFHVFSSQKVGSHSPRSSYGAGSALYVSTTTTPTKLNYIHSYTMDKIIFTADQLLM